MWSFVGNKSNKQWIWLAVDETTREIVGVYIGKRDCQAARRLWQSLPGIYRQCAVAYTDFWEASLAGDSEEAASSGKQGKWPDESH